MLIKLEWLGYRMVKDMWQYYVKPFSYNTWTSRTDGQTDGQTDGWTEFLYQYRASVCWRAIKLIGSQLSLPHGTKLMERKLKDADNDSLRWLYDSTRIFVPIFSGANFHQIFQEDGNRKLRLLVSELFHGLGGKFKRSIWLWAQLHKTQHRDKTDLCIEKRKLSDFGQIIFLPNATTMRKSVKNGRDPLISLVHFT